MNLILRSLQLDFQMLSLQMPFVKKFEFIFKKYLILARNYFFGFKKTESYVELFGEKYFYDDEFGIAFLQSVFVDHFDLVKHVRPGGIIIDIGANIGQFNFFSRHVLRAKEVYSFEPVPATYELLKLNVHSNTYNFGIASVSKDITFYLPRTSLMASSFKFDDSCEEINVKCCRLDELSEISYLKNIHLIKIDTEGSELDVLKASLSLLQRAELILIEASLVRDSSGDILELMNYIRLALPTMKLIHIGRSFDNSDGTTIAVDCLYKNSDKYPN